MVPLKQSTAITWLFFAHDASGNAVTGLTDGSFTKRISKGSGAFAAMTVTITEMENGWYSFPLSTAHSDTLGMLTIVLTNAGCKQVNLQFRVHARLPDDLAYPATTGRSLDVDASGRVVLQAITHTGAVIPTVSAVTGLTAANLDVAVSTRMATYTQPTGFLAATFPTTVASPTNITAGTITTVTNLTNLPSIPTNWLTAAGIAAGALNGKGDWNVGKTGYTLTATTGLGNQTANIAGSITSVTNAVTVGTINAGVITASSIAAAALNGKGDWNVGKTGYSLANGTIVAATFGANAIDSGVFAQNAADKVWSTTTRILTAGTNIVLAKGVGVTGFNDIAATDVWTSVTRTLTQTVGDATAANQATIIGGLVAINSDTDDIQSRLPAALVGGRIAANAEVVGDKTGYALTTGDKDDIVDRTWDEALSGHLGAGSTGAALNGAGAAGDPWTTTLPGAYGAGTAGYIVGNNLDQPVSSVGGVSGTGAPNVRAMGFTLITGTQTNSYTDTWTADATNHILDDDTNVIDGYYEFSVGSRGIPISVTFIANLQSANDALNVLSYNWSTTTWEQVGTLPGTGSAALDQYIFPLFQAHVGTGANLGMVRVRLTSPAGGSNPSLTVNHLYTTYTVIPADDLLYAGGIVSATPSTLVLTSDAPSGDTLYPAIVVVTSPTGVVQSRRANSYTGSTRTFTLATDWTVTPTSAYTVQVFAWASVRVSDLDDNVITSDSVATSAVTEIQTGLATATALSTAQGDITAIKSKTDNLPVDPADQSLIIDATDAIMNRLGIPVAASLSADLSNIQADTNDIQTRIPGALVSGRMLSVAEVVTDKSGYALSTAGEESIATTYLKFDMGTITGEASRSPLNALRFLRNKWSTAGTTLTVRKEDDTTPAWTATLSSDAAAEPITGVDPA